MLQINGLNIMIDCGLAQGRDRASGTEEWPVHPAGIDYLFLTHAHIDHIGRVPELIKKGFRGEIICSRPTKALLNPMLADAMRFSNIEHRDAGELQKVIDDISWGFEFGQVFDLENGVSFKLKRAGHILGSAFIRFEDAKKGWSVLFSGDLGASGTPILCDPEPPDSADLVVLESTYGDRLHEKRDRRIRHLGNLLTRTLADSGKVFIPAFSLGRTQELIYEMDRIFSDPAYSNLLPELQGKQRPPVFVDSPLGLEITKIYAGLAAYWDREAKSLHLNGDHPIDFDGLYAAKGHQDHLALCDMAGPAVILAGSGMCTGGRILNHLIAGIEKPENDILFVGYQAPGTLGWQIKRNAGKDGGTVKVDGKYRSIKAGIHTLSGYSAHADQKGLLDWIAAMPAKPGAIKLVHGETKAKHTLAGLLKDRGYKVN